VTPGGEAGGIEIGVSRRGTRAAPADYTGMMAITTSRSINVNRAGALAWRKHA
jgi:hypothetical protein